MKGVVFIVAVVLSLVIFGLPVLACFMGLLAIGLGIGVDAALTLGMILTVALVVGIGSSQFSSMTDFAEHLEHAIGSPFGGLCDGREGILPSR